MRLLRDRSGVAAIEFALVGSVFLLLLLGTIQIALLWWTENALQTTAMLTARCAALGAPSCTTPQASQAFAVSTAGKFALAGAITASNVSVVPTSSCNASTTGYRQFTMVTITSTVWANSLISPLAGTSIKASACYPSPTGS
jgi:Flp pilus assembly protein TadG